MASKPKPNASSQRQITTMRLPRKLLDRLASVGRDEGRTRTNMAEIILLEGVKKREKSRPGVLG